MGRRIQAFNAPAWHSQEWIQQPFCPKSSLSVALVSCFCDLLSDPTRRHGVAGLGGASFGLLPVQPALVLAARGLRAKALRLSHGEHCGKSQSASAAALRTHVQPAPVAKPASICWCRGFQASLGRVPSRPCRPKAPKLLGPSKERRIWELAAEEVVSCGWM